MRGDIPYAVTNFLMAIFWVLASLIVLLFLIKVITGGLEKWMKKPQ